MVEYGVDRADTQRDIDEDLRRTYPSPPPPARLMDDEADALVARSR
jgi:hypothetical protein